MRVRGSSKTSRGPTTTRVTPLPKYADERVAPTRPCGTPISDGNVPSRFKSTVGLRRVAARFAWPEGTTLCLPMDKGGALDDYSPKVVVYQRSLEYGFRFPLHPFIKVLLGTLKISIAQVHPQAWRCVDAYLGVCSQLGVKPSLQNFWESNKAKDGTGKYVLLCAHRSCRMVILEDGINDWKYQWFLVEPPAGSGLGCPTSTQQIPPVTSVEENPPSSAAQGKKRKLVEVDSLMTSKKKQVTSCNPDSKFGKIILSSLSSAAQGKKKKLVEGDSLMTSKKKQATSCNPDSTFGKIILPSDDEAESYCNPVDSSCLEVIQTSESGGQGKVASPASSPHWCPAGTEVDENDEEEGGSVAEVDEGEEEGAEIEVDEGEGARTELDESEERGAGAGRVTEEERAERDEDGAGLENEVNNDHSTPNPVLKEALDLEAEFRALNKKRLHMLSDYMVKTSEELRNKTTTTMSYICNLLKTTLKENEKLKSDVKELQSSMETRLNLSQNIKVENQPLTQDVRRLKLEEESHAKSMEIIDQIKKDNTELRQQVDELKTESIIYQNMLSKANETITNLTRKKEELNNESNSWRIKMIRAQQRVAELSKETESRASHHAQLVIRCQALEDEVSALNVEVEREAQKRNKSEKARREAEFRARKSEVKFMLAVAPVVREVAEQGIAQFKDFQTGQNKELAFGFVLDPHLIKFPTQLVYPDPALLDGIGGTPTASLRKVSNSSDRLVKEDPGSS